MKRLLFFICSFSMCIGFSFGQSRLKDLPISTQWTISNENTYNQNNEVLKVFLIYNIPSSTKGTGFLIKSGQIITNEHVIHGSQPTQIILLSPDGKQYTINHIISDTIRDLAILTPTVNMQGGFDLGVADSEHIGNQMYTWGYPLGYNGPSPLLSVGYLAGFTAIMPDTSLKRIVRHFVINGALNPGNSGGPLIDNKGKVVGVVQSKHLPITEYLQSALKALEDNPSGMQFTATDKNGNQKNISESQVVAQLLNYYRELAQVMIGEAVTIDELKNFLKENNIKDF